MCCENSCLKVCIKCCQDSIKIIAGLIASHAYVWIVTDSRGNKTSLAFESDVDGNFTIAADALPDSLFSAETNHIIIQVKADINDDTYVPLKITQVFECLEVKFNGTKEQIGI